MWSRGISRGLPVLSTMAAVVGATGGAGGGGSRDSRPFPRALRFGSMAVDMVFFLFSLKCFWPAGRAHCAWGGHFMACIPDLVTLDSWVRPLAGIANFL